MATGGFKPNATTDFLEEWKAKREKMRAKMLGDIAAATGACPGTAANAAPETVGGNSRGDPRGAGTELNNSGSPAVNCVAPHPAVRSSAPRSPAEEPPSPAGSPKQPPDSEVDSPSPAKGKDKKSAGPSARKGKGQIEKRKLREKRRSTGVVSMPSNESLDELDDDDGGERDRKREQQLVDANTFQNEDVAPDEGGSAPSGKDVQRAVSSSHKSSAGPVSEEDVGGGSRQRHSRLGRDTAPPAGLERRLEELEMELARERQETARLLKVQQDQEDLIEKLKEEVDLLNRDLDDIEDENEQLKQENKTLLKVVGQLTR